MEHYWKVLRFGWPFLQPYRVRFIAGVLTGILFAATNGLFVGAVKVIAERVVPSAGSEQLQELKDLNRQGVLHDWEKRAKRWADEWLPRTGSPITPAQAFGMVALLPLLALARGGLGYLSSYCLAWVSARVVLDMQREVLRRISNMSLGYFHQSTLGDHLLRIQSDTGQLQKTLNLGLSDLIKEPLTMVAVLAALCWIDWKLTVLALFFFPLYGLAIARIGRKTRLLAQKGVKPAVQQGSQLVEYLNNIRLVKAFELQGFQLARFYRNGQEQNRLLIKRTQAQQLLNPILEVLAFFGLGLTLLYVIYSATPVENLAGFIAGLVALLSPVKKVAGLHVLFKNASVSVDRVAEALTMEPDVCEPRCPVSKKSFERGIEFSAVTFAYRDQPVLQEVSLVIPRGSRTGIVGESGSGKSTLINLIMRFYDPQQGQVLLDGVDVRNIAGTDLRRLMALVSQEVALFDLSVAENIRLGNPAADPGQVESAARAAHAHDFIRALPQGYETRVGESGVMLSGGQRQRIAIARALIRQAPILLLDEATAALDSRSEAEVQEALDALPEGITIIAVAHRLSTLRNYDRIIVMSHGQIVEMGSFAELMRRGGVFAEMAGRQGLRADVL